MFIFNNTNDKHSFGFSLYQTSLNTQNIGNTLANIGEY